jgi:hypothetical protein
MQTATASMYCICCAHRIKFLKLVQFSKKVFLLIYLVHICTTNDNNYNKYKSVVVAVNQMIVPLCYCIMYIINRALAHAGVFLCLSERGFGWIGGLNGFLM